MKEKTIETKIKNYLFENGFYFIKIHGSNFMEKGIPDLLCCINGKFIGIEVKATGKLNGQSEYQKIHEENIKKAKGQYWLIDDYDTFLKLLKKEV